MYNPQTRRVHLVSNGHCLVANRKELDYPTNIDYLGVHVLKSIDYKLAAKNLRVLRVCFVRSLCVLA